MKDLLVDFSNLAYTSFFRALTMDRIKPEEIPPGYNSFIPVFQEKVQDLIYQTSPNNLIFALDEKPVDKFAMYPQYKQHRKPMTFNPKYALLGTIKSMDCYTLKSPGHEADDVIATYIARNFEERQITIASTDKDLWQLLDYPTVAIYNFINKEFIRRSKLEETFRVPEFKQIKLVKAIWGDSSDNVPNVVPRMQKQLLPIIAKCDDLESFFSLVEENRKSLSKTCQTLIDANKDQIEVNYQLVKLKYNCQLELGSHGLLNWGRV